ncbi:hypothetical protein ACFQU2_32295 [Siccirubricoccus deserti]
MGEDALAEVALSGLRDAGVDLARLAWVAAPTACAAVLVDPAGRNQIAVGSGAIVRPGPPRSKPRRSPRAPSCCCRWRCRRPRMRR